MSRWNESSCSTSRSGSDRDSPRNRRRCAMWMSSLLGRPRASAAVTATNSGASSPFPRAAVPGQGPSGRRTSAWRLLSEVPHVAATQPRASRRCSAGYDRPFSDREDILRGMFDPTGDVVAMRAAVAEGLEDQEVERAPQNVRPDGLRRDFHRVSMGAYLGSHRKAMGARS